MSLIGSLCCSIERLWQNFRSPYHRNYSLFDILFLLLYFLEQFFLIYSLAKYPSKFPFIVGIFALLVITTVSIQKTMLDSKNKAIKESYMELVVNYNSLYNEYEHVTSLEYDTEKAKKK